MKVWAAVTLALALATAPASALANGLDVPPAPALTANPTLHAVDLTWPSSADATVSGYTLYRGTSPDNLAVLSPVGKKATPTVSVPDRKAVPGTTYYYAISATNPDGEGPRSEPVAATPTASGIVVATGVWAGPSYNRTDVAVLRPDGSATQLTSDSGFHRDPVVSPDASSIVFSSERGNSNIYDSDLWVQPIGGSSRRLTQDTGSADSGAAISPDGRTVAFTRAVLGGSGGYQVMTVPLAGGTPTMIGEEGDLGPAWSPNGQLLAVSNRDYQGNFTLVLQGVNGPYRQTLSNSRVPSIGGASFSPDGRSLSYLYRNTFGGTTLAVRDLAGPSRDLVTHGSTIYSQQWSPLGGQIIYEVDPVQGQLHSVYVVAVDGTSSNAVPDTAQTWGESPTIVAPTPAYVPAPVSAVTDASARPGQDDVLITWTAPTNRQAVCDNCAEWGAVVRRSGPDEATAPATPSDGVEVPVLDGQRARATGLVPGATYRFAVFAIGAAADPSPPARLSVQPVGPPTISPEGSVLSALVGDGPAFTSAWGPALPPGARYDVQIGSIPLNKKKHYAGDPVYRSLSSGSARSARVAAKAGETYWIRGRTLDAYGNATEWTDPSILAVPYDDKAFAATGTWKTIKSKGSFLSTLRMASAKGASLSMTAQGSVFSLLVQTCPTCGKLQIFVDGKLVKTVDTRSKKTANRKLIWSLLRPSIEKHAVKVVVVGTSGRPQVRVDGMSAER